MQHQAASRVAHECSAEQRTMAGHVAVEVEVPTFVEVQDRLQAHARAEVHRRFQLHAVREDAPDVVLREGKLDVRICRIWRRDARLERLIQIIFGDL